MREAMSYFLESYDYKKVLYYFEQLTKIPHGSGNVRAISDYLAGFAKEHGDGDNPYVAS